MVYNCHMPIDAKFDINKFFSSFWKANLSSKIITIIIGLLLFSLIIFWIKVTHAPSTTNSVAAGTVNNGAMAVGNGATAVNNTPVESIAYSTAVSINTATSSGGYQQIYDVYLSNYNGDEKIGVEITNPNIRIMTQPILNDDLSATGIKSNGTTFVYKYISFTTSASTSPNDVLFQLQ